MKKDWLLTNVLPDSPPAEDVVVCGQCLRGNLVYAGYGIENTETGETNYWHRCTNKDCGRETAFKKKYGDK